MKTTNLVWLAALIMAPLLFFGKKGDEPNDSLPTAPDEPESALFPTWEMIPEEEHVPDITEDDFPETLPSLRRPFKEGEPAPEGEVFYGPNGQSEIRVEAPEPPKQNGENQAVVTLSLPENTTVTCLGPPPLKSNSSSKKVIAVPLKGPVGKGRTVHFVCNRTNSWSSALSLAAGVSENPKDDLILVDRHFNRRGAGGHYAPNPNRDPKTVGHGPLMICNSEGEAYAKLLCAEYKKIYEEQGWSHYHACDIRVENSRYGMPREGRRRGIAVVVDEFCYADDGINGDKVILWSMTKEGQERIAQARLRAFLASGFAHRVVFAGHHGDRGDGPAVYKKLNETTWAFESFKHEWDYLHSDPFKWDPLITPNPENPRPTVTAKEVVEEPRPEAKPDRDPPSTTRSTRPAPT